MSDKQLLADLIRAHYFEPLELAVSPDGNHLLVVMGNTDMEHSSYGIDVKNRSLWRVDVRTGSAEELGSSAEDAHTPAWSPDGELIAYLARTSGKTEVWRMKADGTERTQLTRFHFPGLNAYQGSTLAWSPDGTMLAFSASPHGAVYSIVVGLMEQSIDMRKGPSITVDVANSRLPPRGGWGVGEEMESSVYIVDRSSEEPREVLSESGSAMTVRPFDVLGWYNERVLLVGHGADVWRVDADSGDRSTLYSGQRTLTAMRGSELWVATRRGAAVEAGTVVEEQLRSRASLEVSGEDVRLLAWASESNVLFGSSRRGVTQQLFRVDVASSSFEFITPEHVTAGGPAAATPDGTIYFASSSPSQPQEIWTHLGDDSPRKVSSFNRIGPKSVGEVRVIRYPSHGWQIEALLVLPPGASGPAPLLTFMHGGPELAISAAFSDVISARAESAAHWLAAHGYAVLLPNYRGSAGYGKDFMWEVSDYRLMKSPFEDLISGIDHLVDAGIADPDSLGVYGSSYGGMITAWAISQTDRFKAAVATVGIYDLLYEDRVGFGGKSFMALKANRLGNANPKDVWEDRSRYPEISVIEHIDKVRTPTLWVETAGDRMGSASRAKPAFNALSAAGVETSLVYYRDAFHNGGWTDDYKLDYMLRVLAWFDHCIKGVDLPEWFADTQP